MSRTKADAFRAGLVTDVRRIRGLLGEDKHDEALHAAREALVKVAAHGARSAQVFWLAAVAADYAGQPIEALEFALAAVEADPGSPEFDHSLNVVVNRANASLAGDNCDWALPEPVRLYELLRERGLADNTATVAYAVGHLHAQDRAAEAARILEAVVTLDPSCAMAWDALQTVARAAGRDDLAAEAAIHAMARGTGAQLPLAKVRALA